MKNYISSASDIRQSPSWAKYMQSIGWQVLKLDGTYLFTKKIKIINKYIVKVQHSKKRVNFKNVEVQLKKLNPLFVIFEPHIFEFNEKNYLDSGFKKSKWRFAPSATIKVDLTNKENDIFNTFSENAKRNIKKAEKNNLEIKIIDLKKEKDLKNFEIYFQLLNNLKNQKGFYAPSYNESVKKMQAFKNNSVLLFAYENKKPIAVIWLGFFDKTITYLQTGINSRGYELLANYLLVWEGIKWSKINGNKVFDFESIYDPRNRRENKNWIGFSEFKKRFHGEIIYYPQPYIKFYNNIFKIFYIFTTFLQKSSREIVYSKINNNIEFKKSYGKDAILVNNIPQSGGELLVMWKKIFEDLKKEKVKFDKCLVLGVGGGDVMGEIKKNYPRAKITGVELDPVMIEIAKNKLGKKIKNINYILGDALVFIDKNKYKYDLIICDLYVGRFNPKFVREKNFINKLGLSLNSDASLLFNVHYDRREENEFKRILNIFEEIFSQISVVFKYPRNQILLMRGFKSK